MTGSADQVTALTAWLVLPEREHRQCNVDLEYCSTDPFAISVVIYGTDPVRWTFARDLMHDGLTGDAGIGDVRFRHTSRGATDGVWMQLVGIDGDAWVRLPVTACAEFLSKTKPQTTSTHDLLSRALEVELQQLLGQGEEVDD